MWIVDCSTSYVATERYGEIFQKLHRNTEYLAIRTNILQYMNKGKSRLNLSSLISMCFP